MRFDHQWEIQRGNQVTQVLFGWDGGHLHLFRAGKKQYADQFTGLEGTGGTNRQSGSATS